MYDAFSEYQLPEILRTPLQSLCLQIKSLRLESISEFLSRALQSPEILAVYIWFILQNSINSCTFLLFNKFIYSSFLCWLLVCKFVPVIFVIVLFIGAKCN